MIIRDENEGLGCDTVRKGKFISCAHMSLLVISVTNLLRPGVLIQMTYRADGVEWSKYYCTRRYKAFVGVLCAEINNRLEMRWHTPNFIDALVQVTPNARAQLASRSRQHATTCRSEMSETAVCCVMVVNVGACRWQTFSRALHYGVRPLSFLYSRFDSFYKYNFLPGVLLFLRVQTYDYIYAIKCLGILSLCRICRRNQFILRVHHPLLGPLTWYQRSCIQGQYSRPGPGQAHLG